jgi:thiamine biosynthesis lipoprotein
MGSRHEIVLDSERPANAKRAAAAAIADVARIEAKYSRYRDDSVTSRVNAAAGGREVAIDGETAALLAYADRCHAISRGRFDITSGVLRRAWDFRRTPPRIPSQADIDAVLPWIGWARVEWCGTAVRLPMAGMEVDFGGVAKEYAADRAATILADHGEQHALVNLGGDVRVAGSRRDGSAWRIGIADPRTGCAADAAVASVDLAEGAIATSGDYERCIVVDGRRYGHVLDPCTGWPVSYWRSVSVAAPLCAMAGSLATIAMLLEQEAATFLEAQCAGWLGIARDGTRYGTIADEASRIA